MGWSLAGTLRRLVAGLGFKGRSSLGPWAESLASRYLEKRGYRIEARNYRIKGGEADIIASKGGHIVVVEVKARRSNAFGAPSEAVDRRKGRRVVLAGRAFCRHHALSIAHLRCDVITVEVPADGSPPEIRHIEGAIPDPGRG